MNQPSSLIQDRRLILADVDEESGSGGMPAAPNLYYPAFAMPAEQPAAASAGPNCPECKSSGKFRESGGISTRKKLLFLLLLASLSLLR